MGFASPLRINGITSDKSGNHLIENNTLYGESTFSGIDFFESYGLTIRSNNFTLLDFI